MNGKPTTRDRILFCCALLTLAFASCEQESPDPASASVSASAVTLAYEGPDFTSWKVIYAAWIEDETGRNVQNVYVCKHAIDQDLTGVVLPYWATVKKKEHPDVDGISGPSTQKSASVTRSLALSNAKKFRVCFEIDRSKNGNGYFIDRPSFIYKTGFIDPQGPKATYGLLLTGWMSNDTTGTYSQAPTQTIPGWKAYTLMDNLEYIAEAGTTDTWTDMVTSLTAFVDTE